MKHALCLLLTIGVAGACSDRGSANLSKNIYGEVPGDAGVFPTPGDSAATGGDSGQGGGDTAFPGWNETERDPNITGWMPTWYAYKIATHSLYAAMADAVDGLVFVIYFPIIPHPILAFTSDLDGDIVELSVEPLETAFYVMVTSTSSTGGGRVEYYEEPITTLQDGGTPTSVVTFPGIPTSAVHDGDLGMVYVGADNGEFYVVDFTDTASPSVASTTTFPSGIVDVAIDGTRAYILTDATLYAYDVSAPTAPFELGNTPAQNEGAHIIARDNHVHFATSSIFRMFNAVDPAAMYETGQADIPEAVNEMRDIEGLTVIGAGVDGFVQIDTTDPAAPTVGIVIQTDGEANDIAVGKPTSGGFPMPFFAVDGEEGCLLIQKAALGL